MHMIHPQKCSLENHYKYFLKLKSLDQQQHGLDGCPRIFDLFSVNFNFKKYACRKLYTP